jgi:hypothetical protein
MAPHAFAHAMNLVHLRLFPTPGPGGPKVGLSKAGCSVIADMLSDLFERMVNLAMSLGHADAHRAGPDLGQPRAAVGGANLSDGLR